MANKELKVRHQCAVKTEAAWISANPVLLLGEVAYSSDKNNKYKLGDGTKTWTELSYATQAVISMDASVPASFTGTTAPYTQSITVTGITASDKPLVLRVPNTANSDTDKLEEKSYNMVDLIKTAANSLTLTCKKSKPTTAFKIRVICFR